MASPPALAHVLHPSPLGDLLLVARREKPELLWELCFPESRRGQHKRRDELLSGSPADKDILSDVRRQLDDYFSTDNINVFSAPHHLAERGTPFQRAVWTALTKIPCGSTKTYGDIAAAVQRPRAVRAVGGAVGSNPWGIVVPCHRVLHKQGGVGEFGGGKAAKAYLLKHEGVVL